MQPDLAPARPTPGPLPTPMPPPILPPRLILSGGPRMVSVDGGQSVSIEFTVQISGPVVAGPQLAALGNTAASSVTAATISLSVLRLPSGVTAAFSPSSLPASAAPQQFTLTLTATPAALATQSTIQVMAEAAGLVSGIEWVVVTVVSPFSFTPGAPIVPIGTSGQSAVSSQAPVTLKAFGSAVIPVNLQVLAGVTGTISFAVSGQPAAGVTAQFRPPSLSAPPGPGYIAIALTLSAGARLSAGTYTVSCEVLVDSALRGVLTFPLQAVGPSVSSVSPRAGSVPAFLQSGTPVAITGGGFGPGTVVAFGDDTPVAPGSITADGTSLMVTVPPTAASGPLSVITPAGVASGTPDFAVDNYRNTRGFSWVNTQSFQDMLGGSYSGADATALFGAAQTYINIFGIEIFNPLVTVFLAIADAMLDSGGQCYGMSLGSLRFTAGQKGFDGLPSQAAGIEPHGPAGPDAWLLDGPPLGNGSDVSPALAAFVHQQHLAQLSQESIDNWIGFHLSVGSAARLRSALEEAFHAGGASGLGAIVCMVPSTAGGHAVVAYEIVDTGGGAFDILTYNPNVPFQVSEDNDRGWRASQAGQSVINVKGDGTWTFRELEYTGGIFNITVVPWNAIPATPTLPWVELAAAGALIAAVIWLVVGDAAVSQVSDGHGHVLLAGGQWNVDPSTMLPGVRPMPSFGGLGKSLPPASSVTARRRSPTPLPEIPQAPTTCTGSATGTA